MKTTTVTSNLTQLTRLRFVNAYLVREDDGFTLVAAAGHAGAPIRRVALTHGHSDHAGSLDALKERLGDVEVLIPELDARILAGEHVVDGKLPGGWPKDFQTVPDVRLAADDRVGSLQVISAPGHTPGHVAFLDTRDGTLIAGDAFTTYGNVAVPSHFYLRFPLAAMATWDKAKTVESAAALRTLDPALLVAGHGPAVPNPGTAMDRALARAGAPAAARR
jgi:glyoxylase-like metal-dependent hydrolase (beta-lactamase superfamily II)